MVGVVTPKSRSRFRRTISSFGHLVSMPWQSGLPTARCRHRRGQFKVFLTILLYSRDPCATSARPHHHYSCKLLPLDYSRTRTACSRCMSSYQLLMPDYSYRNTATRTDNGSINDVIKIYTHTATDSIAIETNHNT